VPVDTKKHHFNQDRLWTNTGKAEKRDAFFAGKTAAKTVVSREQRRAAALAHSLVHLRARATQAKELNVQRDQGGGKGGAGGAGASLERQCPICLDGLECAWTVTPCGKNEFCVSTFHYCKEGAFYQDMLRTTIGKALKTEHAV
jgi:hypothetical protein